MPLSESTQRAIQNAKVTKAIEASLRAESFLNAVGNVGHNKLAARWLAAQLGGGLLSTGSLTMYQGLQDTALIDLLLVWRGDGVEPEKPTPPPRYAVGAPPITGTHPAALTTRWGTHPTQPPLRTGPIDAGPLQAVRRARV